MNKQEEEEFLSRLRATFAVEAREHMHAMSSCLLEMENNPAADDAPARLEVVFRHAHSLKGAARAVELSDIEAVCQALEDVLAVQRQRQAYPSLSAFDALHGAIDLIGALMLEPQGASPAETRAKVSEAIRRLHLSDATETPPAAGPRVPATVPESLAADAVTPTARTDTVRVSVSKLELLLLEAEEMLSAKQALAQHMTELQSIEQGFEQWAGHWSRVQSPARSLRTVPAVAEFLDWNTAWVRSLEQKIQVLGRLVARNQHVIGKQVDDLLAGSKTLLMLPFSAVSDAFPKLVRDLCRDQGKEVELVLQGGEVEIGKRVLEGIKDTLMHLLRNAIDHGIELPDRRRHGNKPARARLSVTVAPLDGGSVEIMVADDGAGVDPALVKAAAVRRGHIKAEDADALDDSEVLELMFRSDISTSPLITEISGRGLGLAIAREQAAELGGRITVDSRPGLGTTFRLVLPLTLSTFRGVLVRAGGQVLVIPNAHVERVARIDAGAIKSVENRQTIALDSKALSLAWLDEVLDMPVASSPAPAAGFVQVVVLGAGGTRIAFVVDDVLHDEEVLVKTFSRPLSRVRNISGAAILASGKVAPILNVADLLKSATRSQATPRRLQPSAVPGGPGPAKRILLVEDSITSRMLLKGILDAAGYVVETAVDGVDALTTLRTDDFDLVVSDVEMPRLNGFDLTARIRADKTLSELPVILVTARSSREDREHGIDVGANAYIVKSSFDQSNLLDAVGRLV